jgi:hypothetical protein
MTYLIRCDLIIHELIIRVLLLILSPTGPAPIATITTFRLGTLHSPVGNLQAWW